MLKKLISCKLYLCIERREFFSLRENECVLLDKSLEISIHKIMSQLKYENINDLNFKLVNKSPYTLEFNVGKNNSSMVGNNMNICYIKDDYFLIDVNGEKVKSENYTIYYKCDGLDGLYSFIRYIFNNLDLFF